MRIWNVMLLAAGLALQTGCRSGENRVEKVDDKDVLVRCHFVGGAQLSNNTNAAKLKEIWNYPETRRLVTQTLQRLAHSPKKLFPAAIDAGQDERGAAQLQPLLKDLLGEESFIQVRGAADPPAEWTLMAHLAGGRSKAWRTALSELDQVWKLGRIETNTVAGISCLEVKRSGNPGLIRWTDTGDWFVLGVGQDAVPAFDDAVRRIKSVGRPVEVGSNSWFEIELNLPRLARLLEITPSVGWPAVWFSAVGRGDSLRVNGRLNFNEPTTGVLDPWRVPTNLIHDPLISFTAARGMAPLLQRCQLLNQLGIAPVPNQFFVWAQSQIPFQTFWAWPSSNAMSSLPRVAERAPVLLGTNWQQRGLAQISWYPTNEMVFWKGLPIVTPYLKPWTNGIGDYITGGLFPAMPGSNPPPVELLSQLSARTNLVYYDWEITQGRLAQWHVMSQTMSVIATRPQLATNSNSLQWELKVAPSLGNTITEIVADSPTQWSLTRKSHLGLTGCEIVALTRWLESKDFPKPGFDLPGQPPPIHPKPAAPAAPTKPK